MIIPTRSTSRFLAQADVPALFTAVIDHVTVDQTLRNPYVLHFAGGAVKPLPLNVVNRRTLVAAFGDDDQHWRGRSIEVYVDPSVTNSRGEVVGGIRLRVPMSRPDASAAHAPIPAAQPAPHPAPQPHAPNRPTQPATQPATRPTATRTPEERHRMIMDAFATVTTEDLVQQWLEWANRNRCFTPEQLRRQTNARRAALARIRASNHPR